MNKVRAFQVLSLLLSILMLVACTVAPAPTGETAGGSASSGDQPTIVLYNNSGTLQYDAGGSDPAGFGVATGCLFTTGSATLGSGITLATVVGNVAGGAGDRVG